MLAFTIQGFRSSVDLPMRCTLCELFSSVLTRLDPAQVLSRVSDQTNKQGTPQAMLSMPPPNSTSG